MQWIGKLASSLPVQLTSMILIVFLGGDLIPTCTKEFFFTVSVLIKDLLILALPYIIFAYLFSTLVDLQHGALLFIVSLVCSVIFMNFLGLNIAYFLGGFLSQASGLSPVTTDPALELHALWRLNPPWIVTRILQNENGLILGVLAGLGLGYFKVKNLDKKAEKLKSIASFILNKMFIPVVALFILGFILKMQHEGTLSYVLKEYGPVYLMIAGSQITYQLLLLFMGAKLNPLTFLGYLKNLVSPLVAALTTMSSAAALPFSIKAAEKNTQNPLIGRSVIPSTVNINLMGDSMSIPLMIIATMITFGLGVPTYDLFLNFALQYVLYMFTVAAIPGGGVIIMVPVMSEVLAFDGEMISLVTALYLLYDAIGTSMNVMGNGVFVILYNRIFGGLLSKKSNPSTR